MVYNGDDDLGWTMGVFSAQGWGNWGNWLQLDSKLCVFSPFFSGPLREL